MNLLIRFLCSENLIKSNNYCFLKNDKKPFLEAQITFFASIVIWFTIPEYFPPHMKGSVGIFDGPHLFGQFRLVSPVCVSKGCQVVSVPFFEVSG